MQIKSPKDLIVYQKAYALATEIFETSTHFPAEEKYSLTDQIRRSSRSTCANLAEAWRKRRYQAAFVSKISDAEGEAAETQTWIEFSARCGYLERDEAKILFVEYDEIIAMLVSMISNSSKWILPSGRK
jgi:four helix bundle protein